MFVNLEAALPGSVSNPKARPTSSSPTGTDHQHGPLPPAAQMATTSLPDPRAATRLGAPRDPKASDSVDSADSIDSTDSADSIHSIGAGSPTHGRSDQYLLGFLVPKPPGRTRGSRCIYIGGAGMARGTAAEQEAGETNRGGRGDPVRLG
jgi:hypothetical protein